MIVHLFILLQMGRKVHLTVRKRRSNERQKVKERKLQLFNLFEEAHKIKRVYGGPLELKGKLLDLIIVIVIKKVWNPRYTFM